MYQINAIKVCEDKKEKPVSVCFDDKEKAEENLQWFMAHGYKNIVVYIIGANNQVFTLRYK
jgi:DNA-binding LacI/PurR family transcriptional regulator